MKEIHSNANRKCRFLCVSPHSQKQNVLWHNLAFILMAIEMRDSTKIWIIPIYEYDVWDYLDLFPADEQK